jgi:NTE family protein
LLSASSSAMIRRMAQLTIERYQPDVVIHVPADSAGTFEFFKATELIELGKELALEAIESLVE